MEIDKLDRKILAVLDRDARESESMIGRRVRASKQVVGYRMERLEEAGVIENYYTMLDVGSLGFDSYYVFLQLTGLGSKMEDELYEKVMKLPYVSWLLTGVGRWDGVVLFTARSIGGFNAQLDELKAMLGKYLHEYTFTALVSAEHIGYKFLGSSGSGATPVRPKGAGYVFEDIDRKILNAMNMDARMPVTDLADKIGEPLHTVRYRLKKLIGDNIIQGFKPKINVGKLGFAWHLVLVKFNSISEERLGKFVEYCKAHKLVYYVTKTVGMYNVMLDVHVRDSEEFRGFLFDLKNNYGDVIALYESMLVFEEKFLSYVPKIVLS